MRAVSYGAGREITEYFNSPAWHAPREAELLAAIMTELMQAGKPATSKAIIASVIGRLEREVDEAMLQGYRNVLAQIMDEQRE
ncbi:MULTISPECIES: biofilm development regulator YmgB/AriR family protein [Winslowiella]|uniref:biofilm development regulator YmgB/AriR family protein n=1 Tax=Winslowiella TaxID=2997349 RepID=UPI0028BDAF34|nr:biofilm development regulator YmgB/AriR family protein [Winslowiella toletana]WNN45319.1 biofilm development regulator YmgB/AriR family protein [Winslowiella toletana]